MVDRTHRELTGDDIARIARTYHGWRLPAGKAGSEKEAGGYADVPGFCRRATLEEVRKHGHVLTPGRYVGAEAQEDDGEPFAEKFAHLRRQLRSSSLSRPGWRRRFGRTSSGLRELSRGRPRNDERNIGEACAYRVADPDDSRSVRDAGWRLGQGLRRSDSGSEPGRSAQR